MAGTQLPLRTDQDKSILGQVPLGLLQPSLMQKHLFLDTRVKMCLHVLSDFPANNRGIDVLCSVL